MTFRRCFFDLVFAQPNGPTSEMQKRARSPIYVENMTSDDVFVICFNEAVFFFNMFCHTGFTESYESLKEWNQDIDFSDFDQNFE